MQSVKIGKLLRQLAVLISRNFQLIWNQKLTLGSLILQAPLMVLVIKLVGEPDCFTSVKPASAFRCWQRCSARPSPCFWWKPCRRAF